MDAIRFGSGTRLADCPKVSTCRGWWLPRINGFLHGIVAMCVKDGYHSVYTAMLQQFPYAEIVLVYGLER